MRSRGSGRPVPVRWVVPASAPETWPVSTWRVALGLGCLLALVLSWQVLARDQPREAGLHALAAVAALTTAYLLLVQSTILGDARPRWMAGGFLLVAVAALVQDVTLAAVGVGPGADLAVTLAWLLVLPLAALSSPLVLRTPALVAVPLGVGALGLVPLLQLGHRASAGRLGSGAHLVLAGTALLCLAGVGVWLRPAAGGRGWVAAALVLTAASCLVRLTTSVRSGSAWAAGEYLQLAAVVVPAVGLAGGSTRGYHRQTRRWRQLETEVRRLRAASPLMPGRSITPEDDAGLPGAPDVRALLDLGGARVALQPVVELSTGRVVGQEALARLGGRVPTDRWFRAASRCGYGLELERVTLHNALQRLGALGDEEFLAVNISPGSLLDPEVAQLFDDVDLTRIVVEITEHDAVPDYAEMRRTLDGLRSRGARIAVDDTGAGFASLRHVLLLRPEVLKLDVSLTRGIDTDPRQRALVVALIGFAAEVGAVVLAEGVETARQKDALLEIGVQLGQGWHLGLPALTEPEDP